MNLELWDFISYTACGQKFFQTKRQNYTQIISHTVSQYTLTILVVMLAVFFPTRWCEARTRGLYFLQRAGG